MRAGLSGRPPFDCKTREQTEAWFVESLDKWREAQGLKSMVLVGHSLGGYLSACYALAHPEHVTQLVLVCPAGAWPMHAAHVPRRLCSRVLCFVYGNGTLLLFEHSLPTSTAGRLSSCYVSTVVGVYCAPAASPKVLLLRCWRWCE